MNTHNTWLSKYLFLSFPLPSLENIINIFLILLT